MLAKFSQAFLVVIRVAVAPLLLVSHAQKVDAFSLVPNSYDAWEMNQKPVKGDGWYLSQRQPEKGEHFLQQGEAHLQRQEIKQAILAFRLALQNYKKQNNFEGMGLSYTYLGLAFEAKGNYEDAIRHFKQALTFAQQANDQSLVANIWGNLGNTYFSQSNYSNGLDAYEQSLKFWRQLNNKEKQSAVLRGLGNIQLELGNYKKAEILLLDSLKIAESSDNKVSITYSYNSLGVLYSNQDQYSQSIHYYQKGLVVSESISNLKLRERLRIQLLNNLGSAEHSQGDFNQALQYFQESISLSQENPNPRLKGAAIRGLGAVYLSLKQPDKAIQLLEQSLKISQQTNNQKAIATTSHMLGASYWLKGDLDFATQHLRSAIDILEKLRLGLKDIDKVSLFDTQIHSYALFRRVLAEKGEYGAALEASERGRSRAFLELLTKRSLTRKPLNNSFNITKLDNLPSLQNLRQVAQQQNATLVEYAFIADEEFVAKGKLHGDFIKIYIWIVQPNGDIAFREVNLTPAQTKLLKQAGTWANDWSEYPDREKALKQEFSELHQNLYSILITPISDLLPTNPDSPVIFIPYRELFQVSFPALQAPDGTYLIQRHTILTAPAIQVLALTSQQQKSATRSQANALVIGNPSMPVEGPGGATLGLKSLPASATEAQIISQFLKTQALIGESATETSIKQQIGSAQIIHFATHGLLGEFSDSGVPGAIALAPDSSNDGLLTSDEILDLNLEADLVVVSACDTGRGYLTGDGVVGLSRAIMATGVPSVMITLWEIDDASTAMLMGEFYKQYVQTSNKAQALRQAMLTTMKHYPHPIHWAPFALVGQAE